MNFYQLFPTLAAALALTATAAVGKSIPNYTEADLVLGQTTFESGVASFLTTATSLAYPGSVVVDPVTRKVFVADGANLRVLRYASAASLKNGAPAEAVFGQALFTTLNEGVTATQFAGNPGSIFLDAKGRLWVPDTVGNRVLRFDSAALRTSAAVADRVYGQPDFTSNSGGTTAALMRSPADVCVDTADRLWVADSANSRVLRFDSITTKPSGAAADGVLGQADFTSSFINSGRTGLDIPRGVTISAKGTLFVTCMNRVLRFDNAATLGKNAPASIVLGQPDFTTTTAGTTAATMNNPSGAWITPDDLLWVADTRNNRVICYDKASTRVSGLVANKVLGQPTLTTNTSAATRSGMSFPASRPFVDATGALWIGDSGNNRVLRFSPDATPPVLNVTTRLKKVITTAAVTLRGTASDAYGISKIQYRIGKGPLLLATGTKAWNFKIPLKKGVNVITVIATDVDEITSLSRVIKIRRK